jgi:hypothetical protein
MPEASVESAAAAAAPSVGDFGKETLIAGERILAKFHPHPVSFVRWYLPSLLLFVWTATYLILWYLFAAFSGINLGGANEIAPLLFWSIGAFVIAFIMPRNPRTARANTSAATFLKAIHYLYIVLLALPFILYFVFRLRGAAVGLSPWVQIYALLLSALLIMLFDLYRRSFTYFVTNFRVIFRYRFFKTAENNLRFSQIRDVEINRTLLQRIFKVGNVRPYTGTEENLVDLTPGYDSPDECFFGVRNPEYVKRLILEQMLGPTDTLHTTSVYGTGAPPPGAQPGVGSGVPAELPPGVSQQPSATQAAVAATAAAADQERIKRLEKELQQLRKTEPTPGLKTASPAPPSSTSPAFQPKLMAQTDLPAPPKPGKLSDVTPTVGVRAPEKPEHAEFGDDRDAFASSDQGFRGAKKDEKKPAPRAADDQDKPRGI